MKMNAIVKSCLVMSALFLSSCGSGLLGTPADKDMSKEEGIRAIKEKVVKAFGADKKVYSCHIVAKDHMNETFGMASVHYLENGKDMSQNLLTEPEEKVSPAQPASIQSEFMLKNKQGAAALKDLDFSWILAKVKEAEAMIPKEYENFNLNRWTFEVDNDNKVKADFTVEASKKGESSQQKGRMIVSNYYEFGFSMDEQGKVTMHE